MLLAWDLVKKIGNSAWLNFSDTILEEMKAEGFDTEKQHQGADNLRIYLEQNPLITNFLYKRLKDVLST